MCFHVDFTCALLKFDKAFVEQNRITAVNLLLTKKKCNYYFKLNHFK